MKRYALGCALLVTFWSSSQAMPLSPESISQLKQSGRLEEVAAREKSAYRAGFDHPAPNLCQSLRALARDDRDEITFRVPVILVDFDDNEADADNSTPEHYESLLFSEGEHETGSMNDWYRENSRDQITMEGEVADWVRAPESYAYYVDGQNGRGNYPQNAQGLVYDAVNAANDEIDFSEFDSDNDGYVDVVMIVHAGPGAEQHEGDENMIWSHRSGLFIVPRLDGKRIRNYVIVPEDMVMGVPAHELAHGLLGLPDLYDRDYSSSGLGAFSMMAAGSWGGGGTRPVHLDAWCKIQTGLFEPMVVDENIDNLSILPIELDDEDAMIYKIWTNGQSENEYFLAENRAPLGFDGILPGGLCIYHIDDDMREDQNDNEWFPGHEDDGHYLVAMEQADGQYELDQEGGIADNSDQYPGSRNVRSFTPQTTPSSRDYAGGNTFVSILGITLEDNVITCSVEVDEQEQERQTGEIAYDDGQPVRISPNQNYWSRTIFTTAGQFELAAIRFMPFNRGRNFETPCIIRVCSESNGHNLDEVLYETTIDSLPPFDMNDYPGNWMTVPIPAEDRPTFDANTDFTIMYGVAPGGAFNPNDVADGSGWWHVGDNATAVNRSYAFLGANPSANHGNWGRIPYDLMIRAVGAGEEPEINADHDELDFGGRPINNQGELTLRLTNDGVTVLHLLSITLIGENVNQFSLAGGHAPGDLNPDATRDVTIRFRPTSNGSKMAMLRVISNDADESPFLVPLLGYGDNAPVILEPWAGPAFILQRNEGDTISFHFRAADEDTMTLTWSFANRSGLPEAATLTNNEDGTADFLWIVDYASARRYSPSFQVADHFQQTDRVTGSITINNVNLPPVLIHQPEDTLFAEDCGDRVVYDLADLFNDPDGDTLQYSLRCDVESLQAVLDQNHRIRINPVHNFNLPEACVINLTVSDTADRQVTTSFRLGILPVNDAPEPFALISPVDSAFVRDYRSLFEWRAASDVENDAVTYDFFYRVEAAEPETLRQIGLETTSTNLAGLTAEMLTRLGLVDGGMATWWIEASDGVAVTVSTNRWHSRILPLGVGGELTLPHEYNLGPNFPNPFNSTTMLHYTLPVSGRVSLKVFDISGREIATLVSGNKLAGIHNVVWTAENVGSGLYIVRLEAGAKTFTQKVMLVK